MFESSKLRKFLITIYLHNIFLLNGVQYLLSRGCSCEQQQLRSDSRHSHPNFYDREEEDREEEGRGEQNGEVIVLYVRDNL